MGREVRKVPKDWQHPIKFVGSMNRIHFVPLYRFRDLSEEIKEWDEEKIQWDSGAFWNDSSYDKYKHLSYEEYAGRRPDYKYHMPKWNKEDATHYMMYETCSEGCPISPAFETPEDLAKWLVDNNASVFGSRTEEYEGWLNIARH